MLIHIPDQSVLDGDVGDKATRVQSTRADDGSCAFVYSTQGKAFTVNIDKLSGAAMAWWFDPRNGQAKETGQFPNTGTREFTPPSSGKGNESVLVLDDVAKNFPPPGSAAHRGK